MNRDLVMAIVAVTVAFVAMCVLHAVADVSPDDIAEPAGSENEPEEQQRDQEREFRSLLTAVKAQLEEVKAQVREVDHGGVERARGLEASQIRSKVGKIAAELHRVEVEARKRNHTEHPVVVDDLVATLEQLAGGLRNLETSLRAIPTSRSSRRMQGAGSITGTVTNSATGVPIADVNIDFFDPDGYFVASVSSGAAGTYTTGAAFATGNYHARTYNTSGFIDEVHEDLPRWTYPADGTPISVTDGEVTAGIDFALDPGSLIEGTVTESVTLDSLENVRVHVYTRVLNRYGYYSYEWLTAGRSDATGAYRTEAGLAPGTYVAYAVDSDHHIPEYYDDVSCGGGDCSAESATPILTTAALDTSGIDFTLDRGGWVSGRVTDSGDGHAITAAYVYLYNELGNSVASNYVDGTGYFETYGLYSGTYYARVYNYQGYVNELYDNIPCAYSCNSTNGTAITVTVGEERSGVDFALDPGATISGRLTDWSTGMPIEGDRVRIYDSAGTYVGRSYSSDASGDYSMTGLQGGTYFALVQSYTGYLEELYDNIPCHDYSCTVTSGTPIVVSTGGTAPGINFDLDRAATISGVLTDNATGLPIEGDYVVIYDAAGSNSVWSGPTDADGVYSVIGLNSGSYFALVQSSAGYLEELYDDIPCNNHDCTITSGQPIGATEGSITSGINFGLDKGGSISGVVTDEDTLLPIEDLWVYFYDHGGDHVTSITSDSLGQFTTGGLPGGVYFAYASGSQLGYFDEVYDDFLCWGGCDVTSGTAITVTLGADTPNIDFDLDPAPTISGTITDNGTRLPIANIRVRFYEADGSYVGYDYTDSSGVYRSPALIDGAYYLRAQDYSGGHFLGELYDDIPCPFGCDATNGTPVVIDGADVNNIDFGLDKGGVVTGSVSDSSTALAIQDVLVTVYDAAGIQRSSGWTDASGAYESSEGMPTGTYYAIARDYSGTHHISELYDDLTCFGGCDYANGTAISVTVGVTTSSIDFELDPGGTVSGVVTDAATGSPIEGIEVSIVDSSGYYVTNGFTNAAGEYTSSTGLPSGTYFAVAWGWPDHLSELYDDISCQYGCDETTGTAIAVSAGADTPNINFALDRSGTINGYVTDNVTGLPIDRYRVRVYDSIGDYVRYDYTDGNGYFEVVNLVPDTYFARTWDVYDKGYLEELFHDIPCYTGCDPTTGTAIAVASGDIISGIDFGMDRFGSISGTVRDDATGFPITRNCNVFLHNERGDSLGYRAVDATGSYTWGELVPGTYFARTENWDSYFDELYDDIPCVSGSCHVVTGNRITVEVNSEITGIDFGLAHAGSITGAVVDAGTGAPISNLRAVESAEVWLHDSNGDFLTWTSIDSQGNFAFSGVDPGAYFVRTYNWEGFIDELYDDLPCETTCDVMTGTPVVVVGGSTTSGIIFELVSPPMIFKDALETGTTEAWSSSVP